MPGQPKSRQKKRDRQAKQQATDELRRQAANARKMRIAIAREDPATFAELILRDRETGEEIQNADFHDEWHELLDRHQRLILWSAPELGKSSQITIARVIWEIGRNPYLAVAFISKAEKQAVKPCRTVAEMIAGDTEQSRIIRQVFPKLRPGKKWDATQWTIQRDINDKNPTGQALSYGGTVTGDRIDLAVIDDLFDWYNTRTPAQREGTLDWYDRSVPNRMSKTGRIWILTNAWHPKDGPHELEKRDAYHGARYPIHDASGEPVWPDRFPKDHIAKIRAATPPSAWAAMYECNPRDEGAARFATADIVRTLNNGKGLRPLYEIDRDDLEDGAFTITGVDLGVGKSKTSGDPTVITTILVDPYERRRVLWIESGRWKGPEIVSRLIDAHDRFHSFVYVEDAGQQPYIIQFLERMGRSIPVRAFGNTARSKPDPTMGVEAISIEFERGNWMFPCDDFTESEGSIEVFGQPPVATELNELILQILHFSPDAHTGDHLISLWICREVARRLCAARRDSQSNQTVQMIGGEETRRPDPGGSVLEGIRFE